MGKHRRLKGSTKDKKRPPPAPKPEDMGDVEPQSPPPNAAAAEAFPKVNSTTPPSQEEVRHLRTLNAILAKQMVEARQERDQDQALLSHLERAAARAALASQLSQEAARLARLAEERGRAEGADAAARETTKKMEQQLAVREAKWVKAMAEIEKKEVVASEESARLMMYLKALAQEKAEAEERLQISETEMDAIQGKLVDERKALERAQEEKERFKKDLQELLLERDETRKNLDEQTEERKAVDMKLLDLEKRHEEAREAVFLAQYEQIALTRASKEKDTALQLLKQEKTAIEERLAESLELVDDLKRRMAEAVWAKEEELEQTKVEMERVISMKEMECADLEKMNSDLNSELARRREEYESLKAEEEALRSQVAELKERNGDARRELDDLRVDLKRQVEEKEESIRRHQSLVEGYLLLIDDSTRKLEKNAQAKKEMEKEKGRQEDEIVGLQKMVAELKSEIAALQGLCSNQARENEQLRAEKKDSVKRLDEQTVATEALMAKLRDLDEGQRDIEEELRRLQTVNAELTEEKLQKESHVRSLGEERDSAQRSLADAERRREDAERKMKDAQKVTEKVLSVLKSVAAEMAQKLGGRGAEEEAAAAAAMDEEIRPFAAEIEAVRRCLRSREAEIEDVNRELKRQRESLEAANARWKWLSSAVGLAATLVSVALAARGR